MGEYLIVYTGFPESYDFMYDANSYEIYVDNSPYGKIFTVGVTDKVTKSYVIKFINKATLKVENRIRLSIWKFIYKFFEKYFGNDYDTVNRFYNGTYPSKSDILKPLYSKKIKNLYDTLQSDDKNHYIYKYYKKYADEKLVLNFPNGFDYKTDEYNIDNVYQLFINISKTLIENYDYIRTYMIKDFILNTEDYDFKRFESDVPEMVIIPNNLYSYNKNIILLHFEKNTKGEYTNNLYMNIISYYRFDTDIYDLIQEKFVMFNLPIPIIIQIFVKYDLEEYEIVEYNIYPVLQLSFFEGFYTSIYGFFPFALRLSEDLSKKVIHVVGTKRNYLYKEMWSCFWDLFNIYDLDYYDEEYILKNVYNEKYRDAYMKYKNGEITKNDIIQNLKIPLIMCERESRKVSILPIDDKIKIDFSQPVIMVLED